MKTRILLVDMSRMLREIINTVIVQEPQLEVVGELAEEQAHLTTVLHEARADVVILGTEQLELAGLLFKQLAGYSGTRLVVIAGDGRQTYHCQPLGELSQARLIYAIRPPSDNST